MAAITVTAANVLPQANARIGVGVAGEAITRGQSIYRNATDQRLYLADTNASAAAAAGVGIALQDVGVGQRLEYAKRGSRVAFGSAVLTKGLIYCVGGVGAGNPGDIMPSADLASGCFTTILGIAEDTSILDMESLTVSNAALA